ncbi:MAG: BatD family protein, partial [Planctomycetota bacterium]|nr:BatD family protein [Planctomycetota bacterium]
MKIRHNLLMPIMTLLLAMSPSKALGQAVDVSVEVSNREVYVGEMVTLTITIKNTSSYILPDFEIKGVRIQKDPNPIRSSFTTIQFGKTTTVQSTIHTYRLVTTQAGVFTIPALNVRLGNEIKTTQPIDVMVNTIELQEGDGEKLILEIESDRSTYYLGEPVDATLRIWIMPYRDKQFNLTVSRNDMWGRIKDETSEWGEFSGILQPRQNQLFGGPKPHSAPPDGGESLRAIGGDPNNRRAYYFYELRTTIWPKQAGELNLSDVRILIEYPNRLERRRSGFGHQFVVTKSRLIAAKIAQSPITIKPTPEAGKPTSFSGAVGRYSMTVRAQPTE